MGMKELAANTAIAAMVTQNRSAECIQRLSWDGDQVELPQCHCVILPELAIFQVYSRLEFLDGLPSLGWGFNTGVLFVMVLLHNIGNLH